MGDRGIVESNPIICRKERARLRKILKHRLQNIKPSIDTSLPKGFKLHKKKLLRKRNLKREQVTKERLIAIERENRRLLEKMSLVMLGKDMDSTRFKLPSKYRHFSTINGPARKKEAARVKKCNAIDKKRIEETNAFYRTAVWEEERKVMEAKIKYMCRSDAPLLKKRRGRRKSRKKKTIDKASYNDSLLEPLSIKM